MKFHLPSRFSFPRICAAIFSIGGTFWAMMVGLATLAALASPEASVLTLLYFVPGWIVYFGWLTIAKGDRPSPLSDRAFWLLSGIVNLAYLIHEFLPWKEPARSLQSLNVACYWWLVTGLLSLACSQVAKKQKTEQDMEPRSQ